MNELQTFLQAAVSMPTAFWSVLMVLVGLYWTLSMLSGLNLDMLDGIDALDAFDGVDALDALDAADALDGVDALDAADGLDQVDAPSFFDNIGFGDLPRTFTWSLNIVFGWAVSLLGSVYIPGFQELANRGMGLAAALSAGSLAVAICLTAVAIQPLRRWTNAAEGTKRNELIGRGCTVKTGRVDEDFGQAEVDDGSMLVQVRLRAGEAHALHHGMRALIYEYDPAREVFLIAPIEEQTEI